MAIDRYHGEIIFECDRCHDTTETSERDFSEAMATMKAEGWVARKVGQEWRHYCQQCK